LGCLEFASRRRSNFFQGEAVQNLLQRYRPTCLDEVLGQDEVVRHGETGIGKSAAAFALAHDLGIAVEEEEMGGLYEIRSGELSVDEVKARLHNLWLRPLFGNGWKMLVCNESDRASKPAETIFLDGLEKLPPKSLVIFTTNEIERHSQRFRNRCEEFAFTCEVHKLRPAIRALARKIWAAEVGEGDPPMIDMLGLPKLGDVSSMHCSLRLAVQELQRLIRDRLSSNVEAVA
jgi:hypothetical protein